MAFSGVQINSTLNGVDPVTGYREDLSIGDVVLLSLSSNSGVTSYRWELVGRPEGSSAGGAGPEPINLGTSSTATFTVDNDSGFPKDGSYVIHCVLNDGSPSRTRIRVELARLSGLTTIDGRTLRMLGGYETDEDTADPTIRQGWSKMLNRWLRLAASGNGSAPPTSPEAFRDPDEWYMAGQANISPAGVLDNSLPPGATNPVIAIPEPFPVAGTITDIAFINARAFPAISPGWLGVSRDSGPVGSFPHYPSSTVEDFLNAGIFGAFTNDLCFCAKTVSIDVTAGEWMWFTLQLQGQSMLTTCVERSNMRPIFGLKQLSTFAPNTVVAMPPNSMTTFMGLITDPATSPTYTPGASFPTADVQYLPSGGLSSAPFAGWINSTTVPCMFFRFSAA